jgi:carbon storage regulator
MLVLTRRAGESVMVGDEVVITVLEVRGEVIRLGIQAPRSVQVHREEVYRELQRANREAALSSEDVARAVAGLLGGTANTANTANTASAAKPDEPPAAE